MLMSEYLFSISRIQGPGLRLKDERPGQKRGRRVELAVVAPSRRSDRGIGEPQSECARLPRRCRFPAPSRSDTSAGAPPWRGRFLEALVPMKQTELRRQIEDHNKWFEHPGTGR